MKRISFLVVGLIVIAGIVMGDIIYLLFAILGLSFVAQALGELFIIVRICGGIYLFCNPFGLNQHAVYLEQHLGLVPVFLCAQRYDGLCDVWQVSVELPYLVLGVAFERRRYIEVVSSVNDYVHGPSFFRGSRTPTTGSRTP